MIKVLELLNKDKTFSAVKIINYYFTSKSFRVKNFYYVLHFQNETGNLSMLINGMVDY